VAKRTESKPLSGQVRTKAAVGPIPLKQRVEKLLIPEFESRRARYANIERGIDFNQCISCLWKARIVFIREPFI